MLKQVNPGRAQRLLSTDAARRPAAGLANRQRPPGAGAALRPPRQGWPAGRDGGRNVLARGLSCRRLRTRWVKSAARAREFYDLLTSKRIFPNSPTFTGAGTPLGQLAACFVLPISDDMGRDPAGIFQTLRDAALIQQTGGGNGFSFSRLRPSGALVNPLPGRPPARSGRSRLRQSGRVCPRRTVSLVYSPYSHPLHILTHHLTPIDCIYPSLT